MIPQKVFLRLPSGVGYEVNYEFDKPLKDYIFKLGDSGLTNTSEITATSEN